MLCRKAQWAGYVKNHQKAVCDPQIQSCPLPGQCPSYKEGVLLGLVQSSLVSALLVGWESTVALCRGIQEHSPGMDEI